MVAEVEYKKILVRIKIKIKIKKDVKFKDIISKFRKDL
jgi:hypothetical protein